MTARRCASVNCHRALLSSNQFWNACTSIPDSNQYSRGTGNDRSSAAHSLCLILGLRRGDGLPLHVSWCVGAPPRKRHDVIDHLAWPPIRVAGLSRKGVPGGIAALDPPLTVALRAVRFR